MDSTGSARTAGILAFAQNGNPPTIRDLCDLLEEQGMVMNQS